MRTTEDIEKNIDWTDQMFDRQAVAKKNRKVDLPKLKKESCANQRELAVQSKMNEENTKKIDVLEKLFRVKESSTGNLIIYLIIIIYFDLYSALYILSARL